MNQRSATTIVADAIGSVFHRKRPNLSTLRAAARAAIAAQEELGHRAVVYPPDEPGEDSRFLVAPAARWVSDAPWRLLVVALAEGLGVGERHAEVLAVLVRREGKELTFEELRDDLGKHRPLKTGALYERIRWIRKLYGQDVIGGYRPALARLEAAGEGRAVRFGQTRYYLGVEGRQIVNDALCKMAETLPLRPAERPRASLRTASTAP